MPHEKWDVLIRYIVQDDAASLAAAKRFISRCVAECATLFVPVTVVLEFEWVLRSSFEWGKEAVLLALSSLLAAELTFKSERAVSRSGDRPAFLDTQLGMSQSEYSGKYLMTYRMSVPACGLASPPKNAKPRSSSPRCVWPANRALR